MPSSRETNDNGPGPVGNRGDSHLIVWDQDNNVDYEFYHATRPSENSDGQWHADQESVWNLNTNTFRTLGWTSADAAGLPILPGLLRPDEALPVSQGGQGVINHAIRITLNQWMVLDQYIYPASHIASDNTSPADSPMGTRFRLKASVDISAFDPESKVIAQAMKDYGLIVADNGSNFFASGSPYSVDANDQQTLTWNDNDIQDLVHGLKSLNFSDFEVVNLTPAVTGLSTSSGAAGSTLTITGANFSGAAGHLQVFFGNTAASSVTVVDDSHVTAVVPSGTGTVDVTVQSGINAPDPANINSPIFGYGISPVTTADRFTYGGTTVTQSPPPVTQSPPPVTQSPPPVTQESSIWSSSASPQNANENDNQPVEVGVRFSSDVDGYITGLKFYKGSGNTGTHVGHLWDSAGNLLATATFTGETATGWQQVNFSTPVAITAGTTYVASYLAPNGHYADDQNYFTSQYNSGSLHVPANGGVYAYGGTGSFPTQVWNASNYWVDVVFSTQSQNATPTTAAADPNATIWANTSVPTVASENDSSSVQVGVKFSSDVNGYITGLRFYKASAYWDTRRQSLDQHGNITGDRHLHRRDRHGVAASELLDAGGDHGGHDLRRLVSGPERLLRRRPKLLHLAIQQRVTARASQRWGLRVRWCELIPQPDLELEQLLGRRRVCNRLKQINKDVLTLWV